MLTLIWFWLRFYRFVTIDNQGYGSISSTSTILIIGKGDVAVARDWFVDDLLQVDALCWRLALCELSVGVGTSRLSSV